MVGWVVRPVNASFAYRPNTKRNNSHLAGAIKQRQRGRRSDSSSRTGTMRNVGGGNSPEDWFRSLPPVTKCYLVAALLCTLLSHFGLINAYLLLWDWQAIKRFQVWRLVTPFTFFGNLGMNLVMQLFMLVQYSTRYEHSPFNTGGGGGSADYLYMLVFGAVCLHAVNLFLGSYVMGSSLVSMIIYAWSCRNPQDIVSFWGFTIQAMYLPWALLLLNFLMSGSGALIAPALGMAVGHLFYFLVETLPLEYDIDLLRTPKLFVDALHGPASTASSGQAPRSATAASSSSSAAGAGGGGGGYNWGGGGGRVLGSS